MESTASTRSSNQHCPDVGILAEFHIPAEASDRGDSAKNDIGDNHQEHDADQYGGNPGCDPVDPCLNDLQHII